MCRSPQPNSAGGHADVLRLTVALCALAALAVPGQAASAGGNYLFVGGTKPQRKAVVSALEASSFNWTLVPGPITIHIAAGVDSTAAPGMIWLDADLLAAGPFAWGVVQHEYAHQVDYFLLDEAERARLMDLLGGKEWCYTVLSLPHEDYGCERFASMLAWAYWPSPENCMRPADRTTHARRALRDRFRVLVAEFTRPQSAERRSQATVSVR
jgi:hypothetical protein